MQKALLCFYSGYFAAALNGEFIEAKKKLIQLPTEDPATFRLVGHWIYTRRTLGLEGGEETSWCDLIGLWVFADAHDMPLLQNEVINVFHQQVIKVWRNPLSHLQDIYDTTVVGSKLRSYAMDVICFSTQQRLAMRPEDEYQWPKEALIDLARRLWNDDFKRQGKAQLEKWDICGQYHVHEDGVKCAGDGKVDTPKK